MKSKAIPDDIREKVEEIVQSFNKKTFRRGSDGFVTQFSGKRLYLYLSERGHVRPRCRLTYSGTIDDWEFAIYKASRESYDPQEWMFPGSGHVDGTIEGAMKAALEAYS